MRVLCADDVAAIEEHFARRRIDAGNRARDQNLSPEPLCLLQRTTGKFIAGYPAGKSQVVLDARRRPGLSTGRLALDDDRAQSFRSPINRRGEAGRPATDNRYIVFAEAGTGLQAEAICDIAHFGPIEHSSIGESQHRAVAIRRTGFRAKAPTVPAHRASTS